MKSNIGVFFGGNSVEHDISVISALQVIKALDEEKYNIIPIYISKLNIFYTGAHLLDIKNYKEEKFLKKCQRINLIKEGDGTYFFYIKNLKRRKIFLDMALPVVHGRGVEDGTLIAILNFYDIPFVGPDIVSASVCQDKQFSKDILKNYDIKQVPYFSFIAEDYYKEPQKIIDKIEGIGYPVIVKPCSLGSSIGISKSNNLEELKFNVEIALEYENKLIIEKMISNIQELNCSVIGDNRSIQTSVIEEVVKDEEILSFYDKYERNNQQEGMASLKRIVPAQISEELSQNIENISKKAFKVLNCQGVVRIDYIVDLDTKVLYLNEINTIPGSLSYYLWDKSGLRFDLLLDKIIEIGKLNYAKKKMLHTSFTSNAISNISNGNKLLK